jgi:Rieske Fe-S protein
MTDVQARPETASRPEETTRTLSRRRAVLGGAGALGATCFLAACGTDNRGSSGNNEPEYSNNPLPAGSAGTEGDVDTGGQDSGGSGGTVLVAASDVPEGGGVIKGVFVITQPKAGTYKAFSKVCTHQGCDVSKVDGGVIICPCHNSEFSIQDGSPQNGPANRALPEQKVTVDGDNIVTA